MNMTKPRIEWSSITHNYICWNRVEFYTGQGPTPLAAYKDWVRINEEKRNEYEHW